MSALSRKIKAFTEIFLHLPKETISFFLGTCARGALTKGQILPITPSQHSWDCLDGVGLFLKSSKGLICWALNSTALFLKEQLSQGPKPILASPSDQNGSLEVSAQLPSVLALIPPSNLPIEYSRPWLLRPLLREEESRMLIWFPSSVSGWWKTWKCCSGS